MSGSAEKVPDSWTIPHPAFIGYRLATCARIERERDQDPQADTRVEKGTVVRVQVGRERIARARAAAAAAARTRALGCERFDRSTVRVILWR